MQSSNNNDDQQQQQQQQPAPLYIGLDIGASKITVAVADATGCARHAESNGMLYHTTPTTAGILLEKNGPVVSVCGNEALNLAACRPTDIFPRFYSHLGYRRTCTAMWPYKVSVSEEDSGEYVVVVGTSSKYRLEHLLPTLLCQVLGEVISRNSGAINICATISPVVDTARMRALVSGCVGAACEKICSKPAASTVIMHSGTAALFQYLSDRVTSSSSGAAERNVLLFDLGAATLSVTVATLEEGIVEIKAVGGCAALGGDDFDALIFAHCLRKLEHHLGSSSGICNDPHTIARLRVQCERAKCALSTAHSATVTVQGHSVELTRSWFEDAIKVLIGSAMRHVTGVLAAAQFDSPKAKIHEVVLVGGSSRIPLVQKLLSETFKNTPIYAKLNFEEAAACGAATRAFICGGGKSPMTRDLLPLEVTSRHIGIELDGGKFLPIIKSNTTIPSKKTSVVLKLKNWAQDREVQALVCESDDGINSSAVLGIVPLFAVPAGAGLEVTIDLDSFIANIGVTVGVLDNKSLQNRAGLGGHRVLTEQEQTTMRQKAAAHPLVEFSAAASSSSSASPAPAAAPATASSSSSSSSSGIVLAISLGNTHCSAAFVDDHNGHKMTMVADEATGDAFIPAVVSFDGSSGALVGSAAAMPGSDSRAEQEKQRITHLRDLLTLDVPQLTQLHLPFATRARSGGGGVAAVIKKKDGAEKEIPAVQLVAMLLAHIKELAEAQHTNYDNSAIGDVVMTVPARFNDRQRQAMREAALAAGFKKVLRIVNEPTAACTANGLGASSSSSSSESKRVVLVVDVGGTSIDATVLLIEDSVFAVLAIAGSSSLGGEQVDARIVEHLLSLWKQQHPHDEDPRKDARAMLRLQRRAQSAKRSLSSSSSSSLKTVDVELEDFCAGQDFDCVLTRDQVEGFALDVLGGAVGACVGGALKDAKLNAQDVQDVVFAGGEMRFSVLQKIVRGEFGAGTSAVIHDGSSAPFPEQVVAIGAALHGAVLTQKVQDAGQYCQQHYSKKPSSSSSSSAAKPTPTATAAAAAPPPSHASKAAAPSSSSSSAAASNRFHATSKEDDDTTARFACPFLPLKVSINEYTPRASSALAAFAAFLQQQALLPPPSAPIPQPQALVQAVEAASVSIHGSAAAKARGQTLDEVAAIVCYTTDVQNIGAARDQNFYFCLNKILRTRQAGELAPGSPLADLYAWLLRGLAKIPVEPAGTVVWRGMNLSLASAPAYSQKGNLVCFPSFTSTTTSPAVMDQFSHVAPSSSSSAGVGTLVKIITREARRIDEYSLFSWEAELLLAPNAMLRIDAAVDSKVAQAIASFPGVKLPDHVDLVVMSQEETPHFASLF